MKPNWKQVLSYLRAYPPQIHRILPPCPEERLETVQKELGKMPDALSDMLRHFNGARLFLRNGPLVSIFGISTIPPLPPLEWAPDWHIDKFTPAWRSSHNRPSDWAIGMTNYGGLILLDQEGTVKEWDTSQNTWSPNEWSFDEWMSEMMREGDTYLNE
jgi:hypothetical protein